MVQATRKCSIENCDANVMARGWCSKHYQRWRNHGDPEVLLPGDRDCSVEGCERSHNARGYCQKHYSRWWVHGDPLKGARVPASNAKCSIADCENVGRLTRGWCRKHYARWQRHGDPTIVSQYVATSPEDALAKRTVWEGECLVWTGTKSPGGYGRIRVDGKTVVAHRYVWTRDRGEVPADIFVNHICWNRACVNIDHLELATRSQNNMYQNGPRADSTTGIRNVSKHRNKWLVRVTKEGQEYLYGLHSTPEKAAEVAAKAREELFGKFAGRG